jgi:thiamine biosynthesis lipoprotein
MNQFRRVEHHMHTAISLAGSGFDGEMADAFFDRIRELEDLLSRFRPASHISRLARHELGVDDVDPAVRTIVTECERLRVLTAGDFDHEPRRRSGDPQAPVLDVNALAKGWIVEDAATILRLHAIEFIVNAGGDVVASSRPSGRPWRIGIQHPSRADALLGTFELDAGAVATSGAYERGDHIRGKDAGSLLSVTVAGPDLAHADALATAVYAAGVAPPAWWRDVDAAYGLLTLSIDNRLRWFAPTTGTGVRFAFPAGSRVREVVAT